MDSPQYPYKYTPFESMETNRRFKATFFLVICMVSVLYAYTGALIYDYSMILQLGDLSKKASPQSGLFTGGWCFAVLLAFGVYVFLLWFMRLMPNQSYAFYCKYVEEITEYNKYEINHKNKEPKTNRPMNDIEGTELLISNSQKNGEIIPGVTDDDIRALFDKNGKRYRPSLAAAVWLWCSFESKGVPVGMTPKQEAERRLGAEIPSAISTDWTDKEEGEILKMVNWQKKPKKE